MELNTFCYYAIKSVFNNIMI